MTKQGRNIHKRKNAIRYGRMPIKRDDNQKDTGLYVYSATMKHLFKLAFYCLLPCLWGPAAYAQNPLLNGEVFNSRFENHSKNMQLLGKVRSIAETTYLVQRPADTLSALKAEYIITYQFNLGGNLTEKVQLRPDGSIADKEVFQYDQSGQLLAVLQYRAHEFISKTLSVSGPKANTVRSEFYIGDYKQSFSTVTKYYNQKGQKIQRQIKDSKGRIAIIDFKYNSKGELTEMDQEGLRTVYEYDNKHHIIGFSNYDDHGKQTGHVTYKIDSLGNRTEVIGAGNSSADRRVSVFTYDRNHNWVRQVSNSSYGRSTVERVIAYY